MFFAAMCLTFIDVLFRRDAVSIDTNPPPTYRYREVLRVHPAVEPTLHTIQTPSAFAPRRVCYSVKKQTVRLILSLRTIRTAS